MRLGTPLPSRGPAHDPDVWRVIVCAPDFAVSNRGRVKRIAGTSPQARRATGKLKNITPNSHGYIVVGLWAGGVTKTFLVHRLVCEAFHGPPPSQKHHAAHGNGDRADNDVSNLRWATPIENNADKHIHGTVTRGDAHPFSKLTKDAVAEIRNAPRGRRGDAQLPRLAAKFGVTVNHVARLRSESRHWRDVPFPSERGRGGR